MQLDENNIGRVRKLYEKYFPVNNKVNKRNKQPLNQIYNLSNLNTFKHN